MSTPDSVLPELYLIAHKVRGEPAFDIAHRLQIGDEEGWIIPTSGHRAYPYEVWYFNDLRIPSFDGEELEFPYKVEFGRAFVDLPDHYPTRASAPTIPLFDRLGFKRTEPPKVARRI